MRGDYFGYLWSRDNEALKPYLQGGVVPRSNLAYIRRGNWDERDHTLIFECSPLEWISSRANTTVPLEGDNGAFQGMVSCIGSE